jgi:hypothetical protein
MGFLIVLAIRFMWWVLLASFWLCWAMIVLPIALVAIVTGHQRAANQWMRSLNWFWRVF